MIYVRHATGWRFDAIHNTVRIGSLAVPVSSPRVERIGSWWLRRIDESTWAIAPHRFGVESMRPTPIYEAWGSVAVILTCAPEAVSLELELA